MTSKYEMAARARKRKRKVMKGNSKTGSSKPSYERTQKMNERLAKQAKKKKIKPEKSLTAAQRRQLALAARSGGKAGAKAGALAGSSPVRQMQRQQALKATRPQMKRTTGKKQTAKRKIKKSSK